MAPLPSPPLYSGRRTIGLPALPFAPVKDDPHVPPVLQLLTQLFVAVQTAAGDYEDEHVPANRDLQKPVFSRAVGSPVIFRGCGIRTLSPLLSFWRLARLWVIGSGYTHLRIFDRFVGLGTQPPTADKFAQVSVTWVTFAILASDGLAPKRLDARLAGEHDPRTALTVSPRTGAREASLVSRRTSESTVM
jgi:hypothetical protein